VGNFTVYLTDYLRWHNQSASAFAQMKLGTCLAGEAALATGFTSLLATWLEGAAGSLTSLGGNLALALY
jgi:hypothetical protein